MSGTVSPAPGIGGDAAVRRVTDTLGRCGLIAVLRAPTVEHFAAVTRVLVDAGIRAIEVTVTSDGALACIGEMVEEYAGRDEVLIGAGAVVTADQAEASIDAGADFVVSPVGSPDVIAAARVAHVAAIPGALTPTEIVAAHHSGAAAVEVFPASLVGPEYLEQVHGPLPGVALIPSGGIAIENVCDWLAAGATAVGLGRQLLRGACEQGTGMAGLAERTRRSVHAVAVAGHAAGPSRGRATPPGGASAARRLAGSPIEHWRRA